MAQVAPRAWSWLTLVALVLTGCGARPLPRPQSVAPTAPSACAVSWAREVVSSVKASIRALVATGDGGVVAVAGVYRPVALRDGGRKLASFEAVGEASAVVFQLGAAGDLRWSARIGAASGRVEAVAVATTSDGSVVVAGTYSGAARVQVAGRPELALPAAPVGGVTDPVRLFLAFLAPDGTPRRVVTSNDLGALRQVTAVAPLGDDLVVLGNFAGSLSFGDGARRVTLTASGLHDVFVLRLDGAGQPRWARRLGGAGEDSSRSLAVTQQGSMLVAGSFSKPFVSAGTSAPRLGMTFGDSPARLQQLSQADAFVAAIASDGSLAWWQAIGGGERHSFMQSNSVPSIAATADGGAVAVGEANLPLQIGANKSALSVQGATFGGFLARFGGDGAIRFVQSLGTVKPSRIAVLPDGDLVVSAQGDDDIRYLGGKKSVTLASAGLTDMVLARHAPDGALRWATHLGGEGNDWAGSLAVGPGGALFVGGAFHTDFSLERPGCEALPVRVVARDHPNSFLFRVEPSGDPSDAPRELKQLELRRQAQALRRAARESSEEGDDASAVSAYRQLTTLLPGEPRAWVELASSLEQQDPQAAIDADLRALALAARHRGVILESDEQVRKDAYLSLSRAGQSVPLPASGCERLPPATGCTASLYACVGDLPFGERAARVGTSAEHASLSIDPTLLPVMPGLERYPGTDAASFASSHHWFERADHLDVLLSEEMSDCRVVMADACLGLLGVVCETKDDSGSAQTTVDEFYFWRKDDQTLPLDP